MDSPLQTAIRPKTKRRIATVLGYALSIGCLIWVFHGIDRKGMLEDFRTMDWRFFSVAVIFDLSVYVCHGWRWNILLRPIARPEFWRTVQSIYIGLFANEILPLRTGELIRCYLLAHWNDLQLSMAISSAAIERLLDGLWMLVAFMIISIFITLPGYLIEGMRVMGAVLFLAAGVLIYISVHKHHAHAAVKQSRWAATLLHVVEGLHLMGNPRTLTATAGASLLYLALQIVPYWALMKGYGLDLSFWAAAAVLIIVRIATVIPNAPGNIGLFQASCVLALGLFGVEKTTATGFSVILFTALTLPLLAGGAIAVAISGMNIGEIHHRARRGFEAHSASVPAPDEG